MTGYLAMTLVWLLLPIPCLVLIGKCIKVGQAGEQERHAAGTVPPVGADRAGAEPLASSRVDVAAVPSQRDAMPPLGQTAEVVTSQ